MIINQKGAVAAVVLLVLMGIGLVGHYVSIAQMGKASRQVARIDDAIAAFENRLRELQLLGAQEASLAGMAKLPPEVLAAYQRFERDALAARTPRFDDPELEAAVCLLAATSEEALGVLRARIRVGGRDFSWRERQTVHATVLHSVIKYYVLPRLRQQKLRGLQEVQMYYTLSQDTLVDVNLPVTR